jgi:peptidoglycan hydrolase CwlO-like protein
MRWQPWPVRIEAKLDRVIANLQSFKEQTMSDFSRANASLDALQGEVGDIGSKMDALFAELKAAQAGGDQAAIDAVTARIEAQVQALKDIGTRDTPAAPVP